MKRIALLLLFITFTLSLNAQTGCVYGDCSNGYGKYVWANGDEYTGNWANGKTEGEGTYIFTSGEKYNGEFKAGKRHGTGTYTWTNGEKHSGQWMYGMQHGEGTFHYKDGSVGTGIWKEGKYQGKVGEISGCIYGNCSNGFGTYIWTNGEKYSGNWKDDKRQGQGSNYFADGERYDGEWNNDRRNGYGTNFYTDGTSKVGLWENDKYIGTGSNNYGCISGDCANGFGIYTWESGERYEGYWKGNKRNGYGTNIYSNGAKYTGYYTNGKKNGYGTYLYHPSSTFKSFKGDFVMSNFTGTGTLEYRNGKKYVGDFFDNYFHGEGTMYYADGTKESGTWEKDVLKVKKEGKSGCVSGDCYAGFGTYITKGGDKYVGTFKNGYYSGRGTYSFSEGHLYEGEFLNGKYHGEGKFIFESGTKYVGEFKNGTYDGIGTMSYTNGSTKTGLWENNKYIGSNKSKTLPTITWLSPQYYTSNSNDNSIKAKICVKSESDLQNVQFLVNGKIKVNYATRGYTVVDAGCDYTIEREIPLDEGDNKIIAKVTNSGGEVTSEERMIKLTVKNISTNQKRLALVIGNANYSVSPLKNPANDANSISKELRSLGFEVMSYTDLSQKEMITKIREFGNKLSTQKGVGLFYYAGHGLELNGENYIVPVNAVINKEQDVELESVNLKRVLGEMDYAQNDLNIIVLDACRNNPFKRSFRSGGTNGYATPNAPIGTFIAFGTAPGSVASDGTGANGLYTQELIKAIKTPGLKLEEVFKQVRKNVYEISQKQQLTYQNNATFGDFYFKK